eukprot:GDKJ01049703.1.p1 GENE.GDKJ01049703.1~~GDKJ01049703.1.p1  ORF type:complete len:382 (-),score=88.42 GDKJ01049703.1:142-1287(-)
MVDRIFPDEARRAIFNDPTPNILVVGLPKSGKTSILQVVFQKASPHETLYLQSTSPPQLLRVHNNPLMKCVVVDFPGSYQFDDQDAALFQKTSAIIIVVDAQNEPYVHEATYAAEVIRRAYSVNRNINFEVFVHKVDGELFAIDETRADCQREFHGSLLLQLSHMGLNAGQVNLYNTSIYDHSVLEAMSRVLQRLTAQVPLMETLLDSLVTSCRLEKAFLFDVVSRIFVASDTQSETSSYELCADTIDLVIEISCIYSKNGQNGGGADDGFAISGDESLSDVAMISSSQNRSNSNAGASCLVHLNSGLVLYLKEVGKLLALVCVVREELFDRQHLVDYNIKVLRKALQTLPALSNLAQEGGSNRAASSKLLADLKEELQYL